MEEKFERPPLGMEERRVARQTSQMRTSRRASRTWAPLTRAFWVPLRGCQFDCLEGEGRRGVYL